MFRFANEFEIKVFEYWERFINMRVGEFSVIKLGNAPWCVVSKRQLGEKNINQKDETILSEDR